MRAVSPAVGQLRVEDGGVLVMVAVFMPFILLLTALVLEIGNWYEHRRHLQVQTDAAALAAGQLFEECVTSPSETYSDMTAMATQYGGFAPSAYNRQVGSTSWAGTVTPAFQSSSYPGGGPAPDDTPDGADPCTSAIFDVKATEAGIPHLFAISPLATVRGHARVELRQLTQEKGLLPVAVPDVRFAYAFATFIDESTGAVIAGCPAGCTVQLEKSGTTPDGQQLWTTPAPLGVPIGAANIGVRLRLVGGPDATTPCGALYTECYTDPAATNQGLVYIHTWPISASGATVHDAWLLPGTCLPDAYFTTRDCSAGLQAQVDLGATRPLSGGTASVWATVDGGNTKYQLTTGGGTSGVVTWTRTSGLPISGEGPHTIQLSWSWTKSGCSGGGCTSGGAFGIVQRAYRGGLDLTGPVQQAQVFEQGVSSSGADSFKRGETHALGVTIATTGTLAVQSKATDPVLNLRVTGSQNGTIDCDPAIPNLRDELTNGCGPTYQVNSTFVCPAYSALWSLPQPWTCVKTQTGGSVGQVEQGLQQRILGGASTCTAPISWPSYSQDDRRIIPLIITPFGTFSGSGNDIVPVIDFAAFYVVGWHGDPCPGAASVPKGYIAGHFIKYIPRNPQGVGDAKCSLSDPTQIIPCAAVLTR